jgi:hypothetical protein
VKPSEIQPGMTFGRLTVQEKHGTPHRGNQRWRCQCSCGTEKIALGHNLVSNKTKSCGCYQYEAPKARTGTGQVHPGSRHGMLTVLQKQDGCFWLCRCDCGVEKAVRHSCLLGTTRSCGCLRRQRTTERNRTHGLSQTAEYGIWQTMIQRCVNPASIVYRYYGGQGIQVCERWQASFENFYSDMGPRPSSQHTIDRIDGNQGYSPTNCRWATRKEQNRNSRNNRLLEWEGKQVTAAELAERFQIPPKRLYQRLDAGWPLEQALTKPAGLTSYIRDS